MSANFAPALAAARDAVASQHYPPGALYMVATPVGNLGDIGLRALHVLALADAVACEDTRHTQQLLRAYGIDKPSARCIALHQHNEAQAAQRVVDHLLAGERIAYVSDAGTPAISDPGARLAQAVRAAGLRVVPVPGASSVTAVLSASGALASGAGFIFQGFLPARGAEREAAVAALAREERAVVLLEAPHRIEALAAALAPLGARALTVGRELTKQFEQVHDTTCGGLGAWLQADPMHARGEFALVLHPAPLQAAGVTGLDVLQLLLEELPVKPAVRLAARISGGSRNELYEAALRLKAGGTGDTSEPDAA